MTRKFVVKAALVTAALIAGCSQEQKATEGLMCKSKRGGDSLFHCEASIYELVAQSEKYSGKRIFTIAYLLHERAGSEFLAIAPTPAAFEITDFLSCFHIVAASAAIDGQPTPYPAKPGIYMAEVAGNLELTANSFCKGNLRNARLYNLRLVELRPVDG